MTDKTRNLIIRTASGAVLLAVVLAAVLISRWGYAALVALIAVGGVSELLSMAQKAGISPQKWTAGALSLLLVATTVLLSEGVTRSPRAIALGLVLAAVAIVLIGASFIIELFRKSDTPIQNLAVTHLGTVYVALPMALAYLIPDGQRRFGFGMESERRIGIHIHRMGQRRIRLSDRHHFRPSQAL